MINIETLRAEFPFFAHHPSYIYADSAATSLKPRLVLDAERQYYEEYGVNIHRGVYNLSNMATDQYEHVRTIVAKFLGGVAEKEVVFTKSATESLNLLANGFASWLSEGDEVVISEAEHHANIVPWYQICKKTGALLRVCRVNDDGHLDMEMLHSLLTEKVKIVAVTHVSNVLGTIQPVADIARAAHGVGAKVIVDGSQAAPHMMLNIPELEVDAYVFTGHKVFAPTGTGVLWARYDLLQAMPVYQTGGDMIESVTPELVTFQDAPAKFEAGTPNIAGIIGLGSALSWLMDIPADSRLAHETALTHRLQQIVDGLPFVHLVVPKLETPILSFTMEGVHPHDIGSIGDNLGLAMRTGKHCAEPLMQRLGVSSTARIALAMYSTLEEVERIGAILTEIHQFMHHG